MTETTPTADHDSTLNRRITKMTKLEETGKGNPSLPDDAETDGKGPQPGQPNLFGQFKEPDTDGKGPQPEQPERPDLPEQSKEPGKPDAAGEEEDIFAKAVKARKERETSGGGPKIVRKPLNLPVVTKTKHWFRVHPDGIFRDVAVFYDPTSTEIEARPYFVTPDLADGEMIGVEGMRFYTAYLCCSQALANFVFVVPQADFEGNIHETSETKHEACSEAIEQWTRLAWDKDSRQYTVSHAEWPKKTPKWPDPVNEAGILRLSFRKYVIDDLDHPLLRSLRGEEV